VKYDPGELNRFDGLDNRKQIMNLFVRMGERVPEAIAMERRASFLRSLIKESKNGFQERPMDVTPCSAVQAYLLFVAITSALGVSIEQAAKKLERVVRGL
jgi:hypothetical protein